MADSVGKDLLQVLDAYASWTVEPEWELITDHKKAGVDSVARANQLNAMSFILMPGVKDPDHKDGYKSIKWTFEFWVYYFDKAIGDANRTKLQTFLTEMDACLKATVVAGFDDNYVEDNIQEMTNRTSDHLFFIGEIIVEDRVA